MPALARPWSPSQIDAASRFNREAARTIGLDPADVIGRPLIERISPPQEAATRVERARQLLREGGRALGEMVPHRRGDGSTFVARVALSTSGDPLTVPGFISGLRPTAAAARSESAKASSTSAAIIDPGRASRSVRAAMERSTDSWCM
jgi:PAS domain S-box-containing protein